MKMKKLLSGILAVATVFSMNVTAFAADEAPAPSSEVVGISTYNTDYTTYQTVGEGTKSIDLAVMGMTAGYKPAAMSGSQAASVKWEVTASSLQGITAGQKYTRPSITDRGTDGYVSSVTVDTSKITDTQGGYAVVNANYSNAAEEYKSYASINFAIVFNPNDSVTITPVTDIKCTFDKGTGTVLEKTLASVGESTLADTAKYPNALEATSMAGDAITAIDSMAISYGYISSITIDGKEYANSYTTGERSWTYEVVRDGKVVEESKDLGAGLLQLQSGDTVKWTYAVNQ